MSYSLLFAAVVIGAPNLKDRPASIYGEWECEERVINGNPDPALRAEQFLLKLTEKKWQASSPRGPGKESAMILDTKANPPTLTLFNKDDTEGKGTPTLTGVYKFEGEKLIICYVLGNGTRPKEFASRAGTDLRLMTFRRVKEK